MTLTALRALILKDFIQFFGNRRSMIMSLAAPIAIAAMVGYLFDPASQKPSRVPVVLTDLDRSPLTREIVAALQADSTLLLSEATLVEGEAAVREGRARASVVLPAAFGETAPRALFGNGPKPMVEIRYDPSQAIALALVRGLLAQQAMQSVSRRALSPGGLQGMRADLERADLSPARRQDLQALFQTLERVQGPASAASAAGGAAFSMPFETREQEATAVPGRRYNAYSHAFAGMGVQFILFAGIEFGVGLLLARRLGLWKRLRVAPISRAMLLGSRIASGALISLFLLLAIFAAGMALFSVRIDGSVVGFVGVAVAFGLMTSAFGMLIAAVGRTPEATRGLAIFATLVMVMLGGAWLPSFMFPDWLQTASLAIPTRWAIDGLDAVTWRGLGLSAVWPSIVALLGFATLFSAIAVWRFDWEE